MKVSRDVDRAGARKRTSLSTTFLVLRASRPRKTSLVASHRTRLGVHFHVPRDRHRTRVIWRNRQRSRLWGTCCSLDEIHLLARVWSNRILYHPAMEDFELIL